MRKITTVLNPDAREVIVEVRGGVCDLVSRDEDVRVIIRDYDNEKRDEHGNLIQECSEAIWEANA